MRGLGLGLVTYTVNLKQVPTAAASGQQNSDDSTSQLAARYPPLTRTAPLPAFALWISLCRSVLTMPSRPTETIGRTRGWLGRLVRRTDGIRCLPTSTRITNLVRCALSLLPTDPSLWRHGKTKGTGGPPTGYSSSSAKWQLRPNFTNSYFDREVCILCSMFKIAHNYEERVPNVTFCKVIVRFRIFDVNN